MTYDWRGGKKSVPTTDTTLSWDKTFHQRKVQLAEKWDEYNYAQRMTLIERLVFYSAVNDVRDVSE